jgi:hypothetical protein
LKKSVYFRVPSDIVDLIGLQDNSQVALTLEERDDCHLLVYSVLKAMPSENGSQPETPPLIPAMQQSVISRAEKTL